MNPVRRSRWRSGTGNRPKRWLEALPVGNGRLGAMVFGGVSSEKLALNESTLWSGAPSDTNVNPGRPETARRNPALAFRRPVRSGPVALQPVARPEEFLRHASAAGRFVGGVSGASSTPSRLIADNWTSTKASPRSSFRGDRSRAKCSPRNPDNVLVMRLTGDKPGSLAFRVNLKNPYTPQGKIEGAGRHAGLLRARVGKQAQRRQDRAWLSRAGCGC